ncbi:MAG: helix-turn-helix domain-containing protein [Lachnospiraceae bacterium]|nr:helix-turn-helix domain-containing protein [Lachnospiraceae bacterium]
MLLENGGIKMLEKYSDVLTIEDTAEALRLSRRSVMHLLNDGKIRYRKIGRVYRISKKALLDYLDCEQENNAEK